jgi:hypothetical protein
MNPFPGTTEFKYYPLPATQLRFYKFITLFIAGNLLLPMLVHAIPQGGKIFLPIYFFTLIAAYRFGLTMGIVTALLSPLLNHFLTGMPQAAALPVIVAKSLMLAAVASWIANRSRKISLAHIAAAVLTYQFFGGIFEWFYTGRLQSVLSDFQLGFPGIIIQIVAGYLVLIWLNHSVDENH